MNDTEPQADAPRVAAWSGLLKGEIAIYSILVVLGTVLHALQVQVIAIIMPTIVADLGGAAYYAWAFMIYMLGSIVGSSSVDPIWTAFGARRGYTLASLIFLAGTGACALAPDMATLIAARAVQGFAGGLVMGGGLVLMGGLFGPRLRTRIFAAQQGTFTAAQLLGPLVGGLFAEIGWWRGSFWTMALPMLVFVALVWFRVPERVGSDANRSDTGFPFLRLMILASGVFCVATIGLVNGIGLRLALLAAAAVLVGLALNMDRVAANRLYPSNTLSLSSPVGVTLGVVFLSGGSTIAVTLFLPLLLGVVHGVPALFINFVTIVLSFGWSVGTFAVSGWTGLRERLALLAGPLVVIAALGAIIASIQTPLLAVLTVAALIFGIGIGAYNVHLFSRLFAGAVPGEEKVTAASMSSIRSLGTAFGAAFAGMLASISGLDNVTDPGDVGLAIAFVYTANLVPMAILAVLMVRLVRLGPAKINTA
jgi:MFS family permease